MPAQHTPDGADRFPLPPATDTVLTLRDGSRLTIIGTVPADAAARRRIVQGAALYVIAGTLTPRAAGLPPHTPPRWTAAYGGRSQALHRVERSYLYWCEAIRAIDANGIALIHTPHRWSLDRQLHCEAMLNQTLSTGTPTARYEIVMTNTQTSAITATGRIDCATITENEQLAATVAHEVVTRILHGRTNVAYWPSPAGNAKELAIKVILHEDERALDADEIVERLHAIGYRPDARTHHRTVIRDIGQRDRLGGTQRVCARTLIGAPGARRKVRVYWNPALPASAAIAGYLAAQAARPRPRTRHPETRHAAPTRPALHAVVRAARTDTRPHTATA